MTINSQNFNEQMKWISDDQGSSQARSYTCTFATEDDTKGKVSTEELQQISLFVETSDDCASGNEVKGMQLSHALPQTAEVDLELRLGPQGTSSAVMGTREFF
ncbi:transcriptional regulator SUPERMAN-like [Fagus crenata]